MEGKEANGIDGRVTEVGGWGVIMRDGKEAKIFV